MPSTENETKYVEAIMRVIRITLAEAFQDFMIFPHRLDYGKSDS
jgi:hypothetical protein